MTLDQRIHAFSQLGKHLDTLQGEGFESLAGSAASENPWFTKASVAMSLTGINMFLKPETLRTWTTPYALEPAQPKTIALVMAGNIPLVGFHDFLSVLISGHRAQVKLSSKDSKLLPYLAKQLVQLEPRFQEYISFQDKLENFDAIIATGSDNSARYFEHYFGKYPNIIRKNRTSCAVVTGTESADDLEKLGSDIFSYFGLGCRNVSKVYVPIDYQVTTLLASWDAYKDIVHHHKYCNNYDYQKSILLINGGNFLDNGFILLQESEKMVSPISVLYYERYRDQQDLNQKLQANESKLQCMVGKVSPATIAFGQTQYPHVWDYADQIDTVKFLSELA